MLLPLQGGRAGDGRLRPGHAAFGAVWLAALTASVLGHYPTPLIGYGTSAILGYALSFAVLAASPPAPPTGH
jgi:hypothetical protein